MTENQLIEIIFSWVNWGKGEMFSEKTVFLTHMILLSKKQSVQNDIEHYRLSVMLNIFIAFENGANLGLDSFKEKFHSQKIYIE
ncbi:hypothetical protein [Haliscomenobacter hydrossis]|uniref:Uncharacterized protein n=1 Tax=Haliscomenobacter hydrossis (strain ATCC 27775 / DSM 1100 / LMG 10767 / O) TaxID=760192 RepID=F4L609_HALH1|nr:hypothetical protein [Haliscomenobacter hydrossis]AEE53069.1 hypothetical protein Halhy_5243 [Haliscomenobacter hydrossis DSM 1100]